MIRASPIGSGAARLKSGDEYVGAKKLASQQHDSLGGRLPDKS